MTVHSDSDETLSAAPDPEGTTVDSGIGPVAYENTVAPGGGALADYGGLIAVDAEHYVDRVLLTQGGMGRIIVARDRRLRRQVALKELRSQGTELQARFEREALLTARLQHPSIVSIHEAGRWRSGQPFYAMKLVPGRPLDQVIAEATSLGERLALLPHVLAVADALAYAHKERVIHRDLKPQNVLVGGFGETVVIDWGLAKDLADCAPERDLEGQPYRGRIGDAATTQAGDIMGTPAYMPLEQAEGEPVDERADVYAIGALLYHALAGRPPYEGGNSQEVLDAVTRVEPTPLGERQPGIPPDLLAIVNRAMARYPEMRYPSARELAEDLRRFQTGQLVGAHRYSTRQLLLRWLRRHRTAVTVASVAALILLVVAVVSVRRILREERRADAERLLAERHRADAEELMDFMLGDLHEKLAPVGKLDLLDAVARKASDYYQRSDASRPEDMQKRARTRIHLGQVLGTRGDQKAALAEFAAARAILEQLVARDPRNPAWRAELADDRVEIGYVLGEQGDQAGALVEYRAALELRVELAAQEPTGLHRRKVAITHGVVGNVLRRQGDQAGALAEYGAALGLSETLVAEDAGNTDWQRDLALFHDKIGAVWFRERRDPATALTHYRAAVAIEEKLAARDPANTVWQFDLMVFLAKVGDGLLAQEDRVGALAQYRASLAMAEKLVAHDPDNADWQGELALAHEKVGEVLLAGGDPAAALVQQRASLAIAEKLAARDPTSASRQRGLSASHDSIGDVLAAQGNHTAALDQYRAALAIAEKLAAQDPTNAQLQSELAFDRKKVGDALRATGDGAAALVEYRAALAITETFARKDADNANLQRGILAIRRDIGDVLLERGDRAAALGEYRASLVIAETMGAQAPGARDWQQAAAGLRKKIDAVAAPGPRLKPPKPSSSKGRRPARRRGRPE